jgi:hypothetical protein
VAEAEAAKNQRWAGAAQRDRDKALRQAGAGEAQLAQERGVRARCQRAYEHELEKLRNELVLWQRAAHEVEAQRDEVQARLTESQAGLIQAREELDARPAPRRRWWLGAPKLSGSRRSG